MTQHKIKFRTYNGPTSLLYNASFSNNGVWWILQGMPAKDSYREQRQNDNDEQET